jgi:hypothetical protein
MDSPHRYVNTYAELAGKTVLDMGAAEGIFALDAVAHARKVYLFECEEEWIEPLRATFEPWREKVEIVQKYVGGSDTDTCVTLDTFMQGREQDNLHLKMDIEGAEQSALQGARNLLANGDSISYSICTYHRGDDARSIAAFFDSLGYSHEFTQGYMYIAPFMRKALCRGNNISRRKT